MATAAEPVASSASSATQEKEAAPVIQIPVEAPAEGWKPVPRAPLTADQQAKYDWLLAQAQSWEEVPSTKGMAGPLSDEDKQWLTKECLLRYLRATKWHQKEAEKRLLATLTWRREYGVSALSPELISPENETGKQHLLGYDNNGRPCHYLTPGLQNTQPSPRQVQHLVFMVERVIELMPPQVENLALLINFKTSKTRTNTAPGISTGREVLHILQTHYPERLGKALIINVPWVVWGFFKLITPFIDPLTREKLKFNEDMRQYVPADQLDKEFQGNLNFQYDHSVYWPALDKICSERREERRQRWVAGGGLIGETEDYLTGLLPHGIGGAPAEAGPAEAKANGAPKEEEAVPAPAPVAAPVTELPVREGKSAELEVIKEEAGPEEKEEKKEAEKDEKKEEAAATAAEDTKAEASEPKIESAKVEEEAKKEESA